jgi:hypothetical protein
MRDFFPNLPKTEFFGSAGALPSRKLIIRHSLFAIISAQQ